MGFELPVKQEKENAIDKKWFEKIVDLANFADFEYLDGNKELRETQKKLFLKGEVTQPDFDYPELDRFDFKGREDGLLNLKKEILSQEKDTVLAQTYRWKINEKLAEIRMLKACQESDDKKFSRYSEFIYGKPDLEVFKYTLQKVIKVAEKAKDSEQEMIAGAARRILNELGEISLETKISKESLGAEKLKSLKEEGEYSSYEIAWAFYGALGSFKENGWNVKVDSESGSTAVHVSQESKDVVVPESRSLKFSKLKALIAHEIGTHVNRRENGYRSKLSLLSLGLDRYSKGEEGVARYEEQNILGASDFAGFEGHLAISLAKGVDGKPRAFREVFSILRDYSFINSKKEVHEAWKNAQDSAYKNCVRTFRGTTCQTPGACFTKDIVYREGNIGVWNIIKENPEEEKKFMIGKYDPANARHIWILEQLGISEHDLEQLENEESLEK